jgi:hypothetical protein
MLKYACQDLTIENRLLLLIISHDYIANNNIWKINRPISNHTINQAHTHECVLIIMSLFRQNIMCYDHMQ